MTEKIPLGHWIQIGVEALTNHFGKELRASSETLSLALGKLIDGLIWIPTPAFILIVTLFYFIYSRSWRAALLALLGLSLIANLGYWQETIETLSLVSFSVFVSIFIGIPIGIVSARHRWAYRFIHPILDLMQTIPTFVYLIPTLMLFGLGLAPGVISTVIFAMPTIIRMTYLGLTSVPIYLIELGEAFGSTRWQRLIRIELPYALPTIISGISQCVMLSLSMVVIAALVGADGLGKPVVQALNTVNVSKGFESGIAIVILAVFLDRALARPHASHSPAPSKT